MTVADWLQKKLVLIAIAVLIVFMMVEFVILSTVGTIGPKVSNMRAQKEQLRLENEIKQAEIRQLQTNEEVSKSVEEDLEMTPQFITNLTAIEEFDENVTAGSN